MFSYYSYIFQYQVCFIIQKPLEASFEWEDYKLGVGNSIMVSLSKDDHFQKHCTVIVGVVLPLLHNIDTEHSQSRIMFS